MPQADGSRHSLAYVPETIFGTTPATPAFKALRHNSTTLNLNRAPFQSAELRADAEIADFRLGTRAGEGNVVSELSAESFDDFLAAGLRGSWAAKVLKGGVERKSFTVERRFNDINQFQRFRGVQVDSIQLGFSTGGIIPITFGLWAQDQDPLAQAIITGATYAAATTTAPMDALTATVQEGGSTIAVVTEVTLNIANNLNPRYVLGSDKSLEPSAGRRTVTGSMTAYFEDASLLNKFLNETASSLRVSGSDGTNTLQFLVPRLKYTGGEVPTPGEGPISITLPFQGLRDPTLGTSIQVTKLP